MDVRLSGGSATPGIQSIMDATAHLDRKKEEAACRKDELKGVVLILPKKGQMAKGRVAKPITPAAVYRGGRGEDSAGAPGGAEDGERTHPQPEVVHGDNGPARGLPAG